MTNSGGSNEYPQFMTLSRNKKINVYPCKPQFYCIKVGFRGSKLYRRVFVTYKRGGQRTSQSRDFYDKGHKKSPRFTSQRQPGLRYSRRFIAMMFYGANEQQEKIS